YTLFNDDPDNPDYADYRKAGRVLITEDALSRVNKEYLSDAIEKTEKHIRRDKEVKIERVLREVDGFVEEARSMAFSREVKSRFLDGSLASYRADEFGSNEKITEAISKAIEEIEGIAEAMRIEESKAEQEYTANLASAKKEMSQAILSLGTHEEIIAAIIDGSIPHVQFEV
ncbi:MAG: hypothetical protein D3910_18350, partial [Candidatus Electrothrix sp. ATG2]|nr:hypothetical protein [Candidatus Electrothrix sp. ATG2]